MSNQNHYERNRPGASAAAISWHDRSRRSGLAGQLNGMGRIVHSTSQEKTP